METVESTETKEEWVHLRKYPYCQDMQRECREGRVVHSCRKRATVPTSVGETFSVKNVLWAKAEETQGGSSEERKQFRSLAGQTGVTGRGPRTFRSTGL